MKTYGPFGCCHFKGREGDAANVILTAGGTILAAFSPG
jgi:hypothetical protein